MPGSKWRDPFVLALALSVVLHGGLGLFAWFGPSGDELPVPLPIERGRVSIALQQVSALRPELMALPVPEMQLPPVPEPPRDPPPLLDAPPVPVPKLPPLADLLKYPEPPRPMEKKPVDGPKPSLSARESQGAEVEEAPRIAYNPNPPYPPDDLAAGHEGVVYLRVTIGVNGRVAAIRLHRSSGYNGLDESALETVQRYWQFTPARRGGVAIVKEVIVPIRFRTEER